MPVYNVEGYIDECINSILNQKMKDFKFEIICIDDCSNDGSYDKLCNLACINKKIRVLKNDNNMGVSVTRNRLITEANGKYIWFVDPDDLLYPNIVADMLEIANRYKAEVVIGDHICFKEKDEIKLVVKSKNAHIEQKDFVSYDERGTRMYTVWAGIFEKNSWLKMNCIFMRE